MKPTIINIDTRLFNDETTINICELNNEIPFEVNRIYSLILPKVNICRGKHAHVNQMQLILVLDGKLEIELTNTNNEKFQFIVENNARALLIPENYWIELRSLLPTVAVCLASQHFKDLQTITDIHSFLNQV